ncbi:unnamed protein product, partial [marine sediment metagenome]
NIFTAERYMHILERQEMKGQLERIKEALVEPDIIKRSINDENVWLYYRLHEDSPVSEKYLLVAVKHRTEDAFVLTAFYTDRIKRG